MFREMMIDLDHIDLKYQRVIRMFLIIYGAFISYVFMEICFIFMVGDLAALSIRYNQFLILKQSMSHNYDRLADKQNQYAHDTAYKNKIIHTPSSNKVLRKNLDNNMGSRQDQKYSNMDKYIEKSAKGRQKQKQIGVSKELNQNNVSRKQNARTRGFDIHVTNIQNINDKITSLLGMIKKDKANLQKSQKQKQRTFMKGNQSSPNTSLIDRIKKQKMTSSYDKDRLNDRTQSYKNFKEREERIADKQSKSVHKIRDFNVLEVVQEQTKQKQQTNAVRGRYYYDQQPKRDYSQLKYKRSTENNQIKKSNWRQKMLKQSISIAQYPIINQSTTSVLKQYRKIDNKPFQNIDQPSKKQNKFNDISEMYQQKRNQRMRNRNEQNLKFHKSIRQDTNLDTFQRNKMISKDASITNSIYQAYSIQTYQDMEQQQLTTKPQFCQDYMPIDLNKEDNIKRNDKINTTTKIIDDQIKRIKSKIQQSQQNNSKLKQKFRQNKQEEFTSNSKRYYDNSNRSKNQKSSPGRRQKQNISRMALKLSDQAEIDLRLKSARQYFQKYNNENKWDQLKYQIDKKGLNMNTNHLKQIMKMASDQHNPFSNSKGQQIKIQKIAQLLYEAQQHWQHQIYKKVPMRHLKEQNIQISDLDLNKKGYLNIEDVVCFINLYSGQFYRNRDISLIFRRLQLQSGQPAAKISYNSFLKVLTN